MESVALTHAGRAVDLRFSWRVLAALREAWGEAYLERVALGIDRRDVGALSELVAHAGGLAASEVLDWSPPVLPTVTALQKAWSLAWLGPEALRAAEAADTPDNEPRPPGARSILAALRSALRSARASAGPSSGTLHRGAPA